MVSVSSGAATNDALPSKPSRSPSADTTCRRRMLVSSAIVVVLTTAIATIVYFATRPKPIAVQMVQSFESVPTVIKAATLVDPSDAISGTVTIEYTTLLSDPSMKMFYVNGRALSFVDAKAAKATTSDAITLYLTRSSNPTVEDAMLEESSSIAIPDIFNQDLPYRLPVNDFFPGDYNGVMLVTTEAQELLVVSSFDILVNPAENIASTDMIQGMTDSASPEPSQGDAESPTASPQGDTNSTPEDSTTDQPVSAGSVASPSASPTLGQVTTATAVPQQPQEEATPPILVSSLDGEYGITGTITIKYRNGLGDDGQVRTIAVMTFDIPSAPEGAPLPILYLSPRPFSETENGSLEATDILVPMDGAEKGSFTLQGTFEQELDEIDDASILNDFTNGSWIVWCEPFAVYLGGGPIQIQ